MNIDRDKKKVEAVARMKLLELYAPTIRQFEKQDLVSISEPPVGAYGKDKVKVGLLTLEEYGGYYDVIPRIDSPWWLATPWKTPSRSPFTYYTSYVWRVFSDGGCYSGRCYDAYGVRPALNLSPSLLVAWEDENYVEDNGDWDGYIKYLHKWAVEHSDKGFNGCSPVCYDEWLGCEGSEDDE